MPDRFIIYPFFVTFGNVQNGFHFKEMVWGTTAIIGCHINAINYRQRQVEAGKRTRLFAAFVSFVHPCRPSVSFEQASLLRLRLAQTPINSPSSARLKIKPLWIYYWSLVQGDLLSLSTLTEFAKKKQLLTKLYLHNRKLYSIEKAFNKLRY